MDPGLKTEQDALALVNPINEAIDLGGSEVQRFYANKTVFLTGGTGFLGKHLIEKLFRSCDIKKAFILVRSKKNQTAQQRLGALLEDPLFESVLEKKPNLPDKLVCIEGDISDLRLGINNEDWGVITQEVNIVFHLAATIRFDEEIRTATLINVRGTREVLYLAKDCKNLSCYVHVSTAYCNATTTLFSKDVLEKFYDCPVPANTMIQMAETMDNDRLNCITKRNELYVFDLSEIDTKHDLLAIRCPPDFLKVKRVGALTSLIHQWPNTYAFTKAISEQLVKTEVGNIPICVVRPSIVCCAYKEPLPGWLDMSGIFGPSGLIAGIGLGLLRVLRVKNKQKLSFVPVDYVNNATIAAAWDTAVKQPKEEKIYHISSTNCGVTFSHISDPMRKLTTQRGMVTDMAIWYCFLIDVSNKTVVFVLKWLLHYIPAYIVDAIMTVFNIKRPKGMKSFIQIYSKFDKMSKIFEFFLTHEWNFNDENLDRLRENMSEQDRTIYNFEMKDIDWNEYTLMWCLGVRKYILKDGLKNTNIAIKKQKIFRIANHSIAFVLIVLFCYVFYALLKLFL